MSTAAFELVRVDRAKATATYAVTGDFRTISGALKSLVGKPAFEMGKPNSVGQVSETIAGRDGAKVILKLTNPAALKKVEHQTLGFGACRLDKAGRLGSFNLCDRPDLEDDELHKAHGLKGSRGTAVANATALLAKVHTLKADLAKAKVERVALSSSVAKAANMLTEIKANLAKWRRDDELEALKVEATAEFNRTGKLDLTAYNAARATH